MVVLPVHVGEVPDWWRFRLRPDAPAETLPRPPGLRNLRKLEAHRSRPGTGSPSQAAPLPPRPPGPVKVP